MTPKTWVFHANNCYGRGIDISIGQENHDGSHAVVEGLIVKTVPAGFRWPEPALQLGMDDARMLMDELWRAGVRPTEHGSAGQLAAVQSHLKDMRALAFGLLRDDIGEPPK